MHNHPGMSKATRRRIAVVASLAAILLLGGYYAYWRYVAGELASGIEAWAEDQRRLGNQVDFAWDGIGGFPFAFRAAFRQPDLRLSQTGAEVVWQGGDIVAEMAPWNLRRIRLSTESAQTLVLRAPEQAESWRVAATGMSGEIRLHGDGALAAVEALLRQPDVTLPDAAVIAAGEGRLAVALPEKAPVDYSQELAFVALDLTRMALPEGTQLLTADPVEQAGFEASIRGPVAPLDSAQPLAQVLGGWRDAGGDIEVKHFSFAQGPLAAEGEATLALDGDLQLLGAGTVTATGLAETVDILLADGRIPADQALLVRSTAKALERLGPDGKKEAKFALSVQNRIVSFGPVPLFMLPPIAWQ